MMEKIAKVERDDSQESSVTERMQALAVYFSLLNYFFFPFSKNKAYCIDKETGI